MTKEDQQHSQPSGRPTSDAEVGEATVGYVADFNTLKQLNSSSEAAKAKRAQNVLDKVLENTFLDVQEEKKGSSAGQKSGK